MIFVNDSEIRNGYDVLFHIQSVKSNKAKGATVYLPNMLLYKFSHTVIGLVMIMSEEK